MWMKLFKRNLTLQVMLKNTLIASLFAQKLKKDFTVISINKFMSFSMFQKYFKRPIHIPLHTF